MSQREIHLTVTEEEKLLLPSYMRQKNEYYYIDTETLSAS